MAICPGRFGGTIIVRASTGETLKSRGTLTLRNVGREVTAAANADGSVYTTHERRPIELDMSFEDSAGADWQSLMGHCTLNITVTEEDVGAMHTFTNAQISGRPEINRMTGEVTGLMIVCAQAEYARVSL